MKKELNTAGEAGYSFREFALGFNPLLAIPKEKPWIPYYGYGAGVVRLSLGDNSELGGNVKGGYVRWNFFTNATVQVGDDIWVKGGKFLKSDNFSQVLHVRLPVQKVVVLLNPKNPFLLQQ